MSAEMDLSRLLLGLDTGVSRTVEPHPNNGLATVRPSMSGGCLVKGQPSARLLVYDDNESLLVTRHPATGSIVWCSATRWIVTLE